MKDLKEIIQEKLRISKDSEFVKDNQIKLDIKGRTFDFMPDELECVERWVNEYNWPVQPVKVTNVKGQKKSDKSECSIYILFSDTINDGYIAINKRLDKYFNIMFYKNKEEWWESKDCPLGYKNKISAQTDIQDVIDGFNSLSDINDFFNIIKYNINK